MRPLPLSGAEVGATVASIARYQQPSGCIPWFPGGHWDPWNHVEAAMALDVGGRHTEARRAYDFLAGMQRADGWWHAYYVDEEVEDPTMDANAVSYVAVGVLHHWLYTQDLGFLRAMWPVVENAIEATLELQTPAGAVGWARDGEGNPASEALVASSSCIHLSLRCVQALGELVGMRRRDWELATAAVAYAVAQRPEAFADKSRWSMDWYYPVLGAALWGQAAKQRLTEGWDRFVVPGRGVRCVSDKDWVTGAETCELAIALAVNGMSEQALSLYRSIQHLRCEDGSYWTGATYPEREWYPQERTSWTAAAVVLATDVLAGNTPTARLFGGVALPSRLELGEVSLRALDPALAAPQGSEAARPGMLRERA